jgi:SAM-dependent methyltransferase
VHGASSRRRRYHDLVPDNLYDQVHYETFPRRQTHPDRLAAVARLFGMDAAPIATCRVLEIGCGDGGNLIPMAYYLPGGSFTGVDLAAEPIANGCAHLEALELRNLTLRAADLRDIGPEYGEFDYIIAHGIYSWIPSDIRDCLMAVCRKRLAPRGVAFISYNVFPGRYILQMLRDMMRYHTRDIADAAPKIKQARWFLRFLRDGHQLSPKWQALLEEEIKNLVEHRDGSLFHDDLAETNEPVYFHEFAAHAGHHGLQYLGEAEPHEMFDPIDSLQKLHPPAGDIVEREQYLDFLKARRFRRTLLCHQDIPLRREVDSGAMDALLFSSLPFSIADGVITNQHGSRITIVDSSVERVLRALGDAHPLPVEFEELIPYAGAREPLREILFGLMLGGMVNLHVYDFPCEETVTAKPMASRLVRHEATHGPQVTSACHTPVKLDEVARHLVCLLDGTRDLEAIARDLAKVEGAPPVEDIRRGLPGSLQWLARMALLEG